MAIHYFTEKKLFVIETLNTQYMFVLHKNRPRHIYWGEKLKSVCDAPIRDKTINGNLGHEYCDDELYCLEFNGWGGRYYCEPTLKLNFADGTRDLCLEYFGYKISSDGKKLTLTLQDVDFDFYVDLVYEIFDGLDVIDRYCVLRNETGEKVVVEQLCSASVSLPNKDAPYRLTSFGSCWAHEYELVRTPITKATTVLQSKAGVSNATNYPYFAIDEGNAQENEGGVWFGTLHWSGNWKIVVELEPTTRCVKVTGGMHDFDFSYALPKRATFTSPKLTLGYSKYGFSGASRQLHEYIRNCSYNGYWSDKCLPILYNTWAHFDLDINENKLMQLADKAKDLGVELFVVDDGWFSSRDNYARGLGDWYPSKTKFPNGLNPLIRYVKEKGMMFGIWVEPEMVNLDSELYAKHPDWVITFSSRKLDLGHPERKQLILNLAREDVYEYIIGFLDELLKNHDIDYLKWDMNRWFSQVGWETENEGKSIWVQYVRNFYRIFEHLKKKFPKVLLENCASGGLRSDISMSKWCERINRSDNHDPLDELYLHEGFTYVNLPRSAGGAGHISINGYGLNARDCLMEYKAHVGMMGSLGIGVDLRKMSDEEVEQLKGFIKLNKEIRPIVQFGDLYRLASIREHEYAAFEYVSKDKNEAVIFVFGPSRKFALAYPDIKLYGLDPDALYSIDGTYEMTGDGLMKIGILGGVHTKGSMRSKLFRIKRIKR